MTDDPGVRDMLSFLIARDTMHQNQWLAAIEELEADGLGATPASDTFPQDREMSEVAYQFWNCSEGTESAEGRWAKGPAPDGKGEFEYLANPKPLGETVTELGQTDPRLHSTPKKPLPPESSS
ncbi:Mn-containing catalase [Citreimonas salinaria]|uniref:Mn-containing catalase n=1 Tax=Citreimonas salinaria TaxID=321339 RepID=A0A1H3KNI3_9RHOB|nr:Mn-containing catalase [Citreimonas salinaria]